MDKQEWLRREIGAWHTIKGVDSYAFVATLSERVRSEGR